MEKKIVRFRIWRTASSLRLCLVYKVQIYFLKVNDIWIVIPNKSHYHGVKNNRSYFGDQIWWCSFVVPQSGGRGREIYSSRPACLKTKTKAERSCLGRRGGADLGTRGWGMWAMSSFKISLPSLAELRFPSPLGGVNTSLHFSPHPTSAKWLCGQGRPRGNEGIL